MAQVRMRKLESQGPAGPDEHGQGQLAGHQSTAPAQGADTQRAAGCQARISARLSARELGGLPLLGRAARGL